MNKNAKTCKNCIWWEPWKLPSNKNLFEITKNIKGIRTQRGTKGDCRNQNHIGSTSFSSSSCDFFIHKD